MDKKLKKWKLTKSELERLKEIQARSFGVILLMDDLAKLKAEHAYKEREWWKEIKAAHGIDKDANVIANSDTGHVKEASFEELTEEAGKVMRGEKQI